MQHKLQLISGAKAVLHLLVAQEVGELRHQA
jgi:hypothetical protein